MSDLLGTRVGPYDLTEIIRRGGMATIYKAYQPSLERYVAVKVMLPNRDPQFASRFKREARAVAQLQHHNIVQIYDYGEQNNLFYLAMQYIDNGRSLSDVMGEPIEQVRALRLIVHILSALGYAHARGVIHRDIKPGNILLAGENWPMLIDFGIAKHLDDNLNLTMPGTAIGTPAYMAPEQAEGRPVDGRTDLYALGVVLYEMVTGQVPFDADTPMAVLIKHVYDPPPPPRTVKPDLADSLERVLMKALSKDASQRYQTAAEMATALDQVANELDRGASQPQHDIARLYEAGLKAFEEGRWDAAVDQLQRVVSFSPGYEDANDLLQAAREEQERARAEAQQRLNRMRQRGQTGPQASSTPAADQPPVQPVSPPPVKPVAPPPVESVTRIDPMRTNRLPDVDISDYQRYGQPVPPQMQARNAAPEAAVATNGQETASRQQPLPPIAPTGRETRPLRDTEGQTSVSGPNNTLLFIVIGIGALALLVIIAVVAVILLR